MKKFLVSASLVVLVIIAVALLFNPAKNQPLQSSEAINPDHPGAMVNTDEFDGFYVEEEEPIPGLANIKEDRASSYSDDCHQKPGKSEVLICEYGEVENFDYTIALLGSSKSAQWLPSLTAFSEEEKVRVLNVTKSGCYLSTEQSGGDCKQWNDKVVEALSAEEPDLAISIADIASPDETEVPEGFLEQFENLHEAGMDIMAIRDTPYFNTDVPECLAENGLDSGECGVNKKETLISPSAWERLENPPEYINYVDYTNYLCTDSRCPAIIGNMVAYLDRSHMSATFNETFSPIIRKDVMQILESE